MFVKPSTAPNDGKGSATLVAGKCNAIHWQLSSHRPNVASGDRAVHDIESLAAHAQALAVHRGDLQASLSTA